MINSAASNVLLIPNRFTNKIYVALPNSLFIIFFWDFPSNKHISTSEREEDGATKHEGVANGRGCCVR
jgi:hypothetical protein